MRRAGLVALLSLLAASRAAAQGPSADWQTVETPHFRVHFPLPFQAWALHAAGELEAVHTRVTAFVGYVPARRIEVVVADPLADWNGMAVPFLDRPEITLWASPPDTETGGGEYGDWMELLATHELAHIAHLARPRNRSSSILAALSPAPFGPLAIDAPRWLAEGYATLVEGALTGSGRPNSSFRAMVLRQFAIEGKLPAYGALDSTGGWLGGSMAYLLGSAYLEWLDGREGAQSLPNLWKRMASSRGGGFEASFRGVFGESPRDLYDRFRAELTARALAEQKRLAESGLVEGELWQKLTGGTSALEVSPDGSKLLVRRDPERGRSFLAVWELAESPLERESRERRRASDAELRREPNEVPDREEVPRPRSPRWTLPRIDGFAAADPRWMPDGRTVLFARRAPDAGGVLHWDLYRWAFEGSGVSRVTCGADVLDADPAPDGRWVIAVRKRYGVSSLVRVDLATGAATPIVVTLPVAEAWPVWSRPRVSPDGTRIAVLLHAGRRWRLVSLPAEGGQARELPLSGSPASAPAWGTDGSRLFVTSDASGIWDIVSVDAQGTGAGETLTRVSGGAFAPAPMPDGSALFFLELTARGVNVRRLPAGAAAPSAIARTQDAYPLLPRAPISVAPLETSEVEAPRPYDAWATQVVRPLIGFSVGPSGNTAQFGVDAADVLGRLHWLAMGSAGDAVGPRGGALAAAYRGLPVAITAQLFSAIEKPGNQSLAPRPAFDEERFGGAVEGSWGRPFTWGRVRTRAGAGATHVDAFSADNTFVRALGSAGAGMQWRRTQGRSGFGVDADAGGALGVTDGRSWNQWTAGASAVGILPFASLTVGGRYGQTGGSPTRFDLFAVGGAAASILPALLDRNRIESPALPADLQTGGRFESGRIELSGGTLPLALYADWLRAWSAGAARPDPIRVAGLEVRLERLIPEEFGRSVTFHVGVGYITSDTPRIRTARGYAQLIYRP